MNRVVVWCPICGYRANCENWIIAAELENKHHFETGHWPNVKGESDLGYPRMKKKVWSNEDELRRSIIR